MKRIPFFVQYLLIPLILIVVVFYQMSQLKNGLSPWKGGGFGMYADYYPLTFEMYVNNEKVLLDKKKNYEQYRYGRKLLFYPSEKNVLNTIQHIPTKKDTLYFEIRSPHFDGKSGLYSIKTIYDTTIIRNKKSK